RGEDRNAPPARRAHQDVARHQARRDARGPGGRGELSRERGRGLHHRPDAGRRRRLGHDLILQLSRVKLHVVVGGASAGEPVVLLHGWPQTSHEWRKVIALLAPNYRIVAPDLPGLGESSRPTAYDKKSIATHLREMCERLDLARFHLVGHDWGGPVAFALACAVPERVRTLAILDVTIPGIGPDVSQG